jgi:hypothetical protein
LVAPPEIVVAEIDPVPVTPREAPVPTSMAAAVLVPEVSDENADEPPAEHPDVVAPPLESVQRVAAVPEIVPADSRAVSVPCTDVRVPDPFSTNDVLAVSAVKVPAAGVVPPIAPGLGRDDVEPPRETDVPAIVMALWVRAAFPIPEKFVPVSVGVVVLVIA